MNHAEVVQLVRRCRAGESTAVEALVLAYQSQVYRLALSILDDPAEAEEATQDTFVAALKALDSFRSESSFKTWLFAIALNVCRGRLRKRRSQERLTRLLAGLWRLFGRVPQLPEEQLLQAEKDAAIVQALNGLDDSLRQTVILRYYQQLPIAEIARVMGVSQRTVHNRLRRAHERLSVILDKYL